MMVYGNVYGNEQRAWTYEEYVEKYEVLKQQRDELLDVLETIEKESDIAIKKVQKSKQLYKVI